MWLSPNDQINVGDSIFICITVEPTDIVFFIYDQTTFSTQTATVGITPINYYGKDAEWIGELPLVKGQLAPYNAPYPDVSFTNCRITINNGAETSMDNFSPSFGALTKLQLQASYLGQSEIYTPSPISDFGGSQFTLSADITPVPSGLDSISFSNS